MKLVQYRKEGRIGIITLNDPQRLNSISREMVGELKDIWQDFKNDKDIWVGILCGEGRSFCAGANVKAQDRGNWDMRKSIAFGDERFSHIYYQAWKPLIAAVHGHVYGAGLAMALEADIVVAAENALFCLPEGKVNIATPISPFVFGDIPKAIVKEMVFTGKPINATRAYELGMINKIVPQELLLQTAMEYAQEICKNTGPLANQATKEILWRAKTKDLEQTLEIMQEVGVPVYGTEDSLESQKAFAEKRSPNWQAR